MQIYCNIYTLLATTESSECRSFLASDNNADTAVRSQVDKQFPWSSVILMRFPKPTTTQYWESIGFVDKFSPQSFRKAISSAVVDPETVLAPCADVISSGKPVITTLHLRLSLWAWVRWTSVSHPCHWVQLWHLVLVVLVGDWQSTYTYITPLSLQYQPSVHLYWRLLIATVQSFCYTSYDNQGIPSQHIEASSKTVIAAYWAIDLVVSIGLQHSRLPDARLTRFVFIRLCQLWNGRGIVLNDWRHPNTQTPALKELHPYTSSVLHFLG